MIPNSKITVYCRLMHHKDIDTKPGSSPEAQLESNDTVMSVQDGGIQGQEPTLSSSNMATPQARCPSVGSKRPRNVEDDDDSLNKKEEEGGAKKIPKLDTGKLTDKVMGDTIEKNDATKGGEAQQKVIEGSTPSQPEQPDVVESDDSNLDGNEASSSSKEESEDTASDSASGQLQSEELTDDDMGNDENGGVDQQSEEEVESEDSDDTDDNEASSPTSEEQSEANASDSSSGQLQSGELMGTETNHSTNGGEAQQKINNVRAPSQPEQEYEYESEDEDEEDGGTDGNEASSSSSEEQSEESESDSASDH